MKVQLKQVGYKKGKPILEDIAFEYAPGTIVGLVAPNGKGKSTLFKGIMNSLPLLEGEIDLAGQHYTYPLSDRDQAQFYRLISMMVDQGDLIESVSGRSHLDFMKQNWQSSKNIDQVIDLLEMGGYVDKKVADYSMGMKQRLCFAMQIVADTSVMLMDEVMNSLDIVNVNIISNILLQLREEGKIIIIASHLLDNLSLYSDWVLFIVEADQLLQVGTHDLERILTFMVRRGQDVDPALLTDEVKEPFKNKFQLDFDQGDTMDRVIGLIQDPAVRSVTVGDKSITDYYHELYL